MEEIPGESDSLQYRREDTQTAAENSLPSGESTVRQNPLIKTKRATFQQSKTLLLAGIFTTLILFSGLAAWRWNQASAKKSLREVKSIAVLPLKSFDKQPEDETLRLRMTDSLITKLGSLDSVSVRPTNAVLPFVNAEKDASEIGGLLEVDAVLDGRMQHEGENVRVTLQLVSVKNGEQI